MATNNAAPTATAAPSSETPQTGLHPPLIKNTVDEVAEALRKAKNVIVMAGAGVSVSAGIPDFRTPGTGLYDNLKKYDIPYPEAVFDIRYFRQRPRPFYSLIKEMYPDNFQPTATHYFFRLLHDKGKLQRVFTQNIDGLETRAGLPKKKVLAAHGNFDSASCIDTGLPVDPAEVKAAIMAGENGTNGWRALARKHGGLVKPDIVFFGEQLPARFGMLVQADFPKCDFLLMLGTSLVVEPFNQLVHFINEGAPRVLINRERVGEQEGLDFDGEGPDACLIGDCDALVWKLAERLGWAEDLRRLISAAPAGGDVLKHNVSLARSGDSESPDPNRTAEVESFAKLSIANKPEEPRLGIDMMLTVARLLQHEMAGQAPALSLRVKMGSTPHVAVEYAEGHHFLGERFFFDGANVTDRVVVNAPRESATPRASSDVETPSPGLLVAALEWLRADVLLDFDTHRRMLHPEAEMFGAKGTDEALAFKQRWLTVSPAYEIPTVTVDASNRVVVAEFVCLIPGKEGRGTDFITFAEDLRVRKVAAVRHAAT